MQVNFALSNLFRFARVNPTERNTDIFSPLSNVTAQDITQRNLNARRVTDITAALNELDDLLVRTEVRQSADRAKAISRSSLGLATEATATRLDSGDEVNAATTSYTPFGPVFSGSGESTALPEISGVYDGSNGDDTLLFRVTREGVHGQDRIDVRVYDSGGDRLATLHIRANHPLDREYSIGNGLNFTLGEGFLERNDEFYLDVFANTPSSVDPDKPFDGTRNDRPNFDDGLSVSAGSFDINGVTIGVDSSDTINTVVQKINVSGAGVDAVFDAGAERVRLTQRQPGSANDIVLSGDSSGFVAAAKLTGSAQLGLDREADTALALTPTFAAVTAGSLRINSNNIAFDPGVDSLSDIVARINDADIGVSASLVSGDQKVLIRSAIDGMPLNLDDGDTGLFDALHIDEKQYRARIRNGIPRARTYAIADSVEHSIALVNEIFDPGANPAALSTSLASLRGGLRSALEDYAPDGETSYGLRYAGGTSARRNFITLDRQTLTQQQRRNGASATLQLARLVGSLRVALGAYQNQMAPGTLLDTTA